MASDLSNIFKEELANTLEQLLSKSSNIKRSDKFSYENLQSPQLVECIVKFDLKGVSSTLTFYIPTNSSTKFEYLMLGGMGDLKEHIDDEVVDAVNEIISNVCGSFSTSVNAQGFPDIGSLKFEIKSSSIVEKNILESKANSFEFELLMDNESLPLIITFDGIFLPFFSSITGVETVTEKLPVEKKEINIPIQATTQISTNTPKNLELLYNVKLKLSVRLGTKVLLLKDILRWDVGEIIELEQMVSEPLEILVNGIKIGEGEAVIVEGKFGLKIKKIGNEDLRLSQIGL